MSISVNDLLMKALKTVRLFTPFQPVQPEMLTDALWLLNEEISTMNANGLMIPYQSNLSFPITVGKDSYVIGTSGIVDIVTSPFIEVNYIDVYWNNIQYPIRIVTDKNVLDVFRTTNIQTIPDSARVHLKVAEDTNQLVTEIIFFNPPNQTYDCKIRGKQLLLAASLQTDITGLPDYYLRYFRLHIAKHITQFYPNNGWSDQMETMYRDAENIVMQSVDQDLWVRSPGLLSSNDLYMYNTYLGVRRP